MESKLKTKLSIKIFETISTWILGLTLTLSILFSFKLVDIWYKLLKNSNKTYDFVDWVLELIKLDQDLKHIETLAYIYRIFLIISIVILSLFIIFRILIKQHTKLLKFSTLVYMLSIIYSSYLVYLSKDLFYAIRSINTRLYSTDFSKAIYLMQKMQNVKDLRYIIIIVFVLSITLNLVALITNFYEAAILNDELSYKKINATLFIIIITNFFALIYMNYNILSTANIINVKDYFILSYDLGENNNIVPVSKINYKKIEEKYIDPYMRTFLEIGLAYDILDKTVEKNKNIRVKTSYDLESSIELDLKMQNLEFFVKNKSEVKLLKDISELNKKSLHDYMKKNDIRYVDKNHNKQDELTGIYYIKDKNNNLEFYLLQNEDVRKVSSAIKRQFNKDRKHVHKIIYLGNIFIDEKNEVIANSALNNTQATTYELQKERINKFITQNKLEKIK